MSLVFLTLALYLIGAGLTFLVILFVMTEPPDTRYPWHKPLYLFLTVLITVLWPITVPAIAIYWLISEVKEARRADD